MMDVTLSPVKNSSSLEYLDNFVVSSSPAAECIHHLRRILAVLGYAGITLKMKSCTFLNETIFYHGHVICPRRFETAWHTTDFINGQKMSRNVAKLKIS